VRIPSRRAVRMIRRAISPRLAINRLSIIRAPCGREGKQSFFEKKDQKTFVSYVRDRFSRDWRMGVFCFFFAGKKVFLYILNTPN
jgi:hypothetical protein